MHSYVVCKRIHIVNSHLSLYIHILRTIVHAYYIIL